MVWRSTTRRLIGLDVITDGEIRRESYSNRFATRSTGSTSTTPAPRSTVPATRTRPAGGRARSGARAPCRSATSSSCAAHRPPHPGHGPWAVHDDPAGAERPLRRPPPRWPWTMRRRSTTSFVTRWPPAPTSSRSTSRICRHGRSRRASTRLPASIVRLRESAPIPRCTPASATRRSSRSARPVTRSWPSSRTAPLMRSARGRPATSRSRRSSSSCPTKRIVLGVLDLGDPAAEISRRRWPTGSVPRCATSPAERLSVAPDCGMKYLPRELAQAKLRALVEGAQIVRAELSR